MNGPRVIAIVAVAAWVTFGVLWWLAGRTVDDALASIDTPDDAPLFPSPWDQHVNEALNVAADRAPCGCLIDLCPTHQGAQDRLRERMGRLLDGVSERMIRRSLERGWDDDEVRRLLDDKDYR